MDVEYAVIQTTCIVRIYNVVKYFLSSSAMTDIHHLRIEQGIDLRQQFNSLQVYQVANHCGSDFVVNSLCLSDMVNAEKKCLTEPFNNFCSTLRLAQSYLNDSWENICLWQPVETFFLNERH